MKIYTLNYSDGDNYGAVLVQYALNHALAIYGEVIGIKFLRTRVVKKESIPKWLFTRIWRVIKEPENIKHYFVAVRAKLNGDRKLEIERRNAFSNASAEVFAKFRKCYYRTTEEISTFDKLLSIGLSNNDAVLCGSDVIWEQGKNYEYARVYFLDWVPDDVKKIACAPSWGQANINKFDKCVKEKISSCLQRFSAVSVRERSGIDICAQLGRSDAVWLPDPTMFLTSKEWNEIAQSPSISDYVLDYMVPTNTAVNTATTLSVFEERVIKFPDLSAATVWPSPEEWLGYIKDAKFVVTNSFHGVVFCLLYHKPFIYTKLINEFAHYNERLYSLLGRFDLMDRMITEETCNDKTKIAEIINRKIDWEKVDAEISAWRHQAFEYVDKNLRDA